MTEKLYAYLVRADGYPPERVPAKSFPAAERAYRKKHRVPVSVIVISGSGWGGARPGAGRPPVETPLERRTIRLSREQWRQAESIGQGNAAAGIRSLLDRQ